MNLDTVSISFPAKKNYALLLRMFASGAAASYDLPVDMLEDLRMAAEEACDCLLSGDVKDDAQLMCDLYRPDEKFRSFILVLVFKIFIKVF